MHPHRPLNAPTTTSSFWSDFLGGGSALGAGQPLCSTYIAAGRSGSCRWKRHGAAGLGRRTILATRLAGYPSARFIRGAPALISYAHQRQIVLFASRELL
jgi:hypothetical protein